MEAIKKKSQFKGKGMEKGKKNGKLLRKPINKHSKISTHQKIFKKKDFKKEKKTLNNNKDLAIINNHQHNDEIIEEEDSIIEEEKTSNTVQIKKNNKITKVIKPIYQLQMIYTGGKVLLSPNEKDLYCSCNNTVNVFNLEKNVIINTISQVSYFLMTSEAYFIKGKRRNFQFYFTSKWKKYCDIYQE